MSTEETKESKDLATNPSSVQLPAHLQEDAGVGITQSLLEDVTPPRLKIVQKQSDDGLQERHKMGSAILMPDEIPIVAFGDDEPCLFVPILHYKEWCVWNHISTRGTLPMIADRTFDPNSPIALRAKDFAMRVDDEKKQRYVEHVNYLVMVRGIPVPVLFSFSRAEHKSGKRLASLLVMRRQSGMQPAIYGCRFQATVGRRDNQLGSWYGLDIGNPENADPWVTDPVEYAAYKQFHEQVQKLYEAQKIVANYEDDYATETEAAESSNSEY